MFGEALAGNVRHQTIHLWILEVDQVIGIQTNHHLEGKSYVARINRKLGTITHPSTSA